MKNVISQSLGLDLVNINVYATVYQNIPLSSRDRAIFTFFRIWRSAKPRPMINAILQFLELDLVNIIVSAKFYQNIPNGLRVKFILVGLGRNIFVCCLAHRGSTVGLHLLQCSSGVVRHPRDLKVSVATRFCRVLIFASS